MGSADRSGGGYSSKLRFVIYHHQRRLDRALFHLEDLKAEVNTWLKERPHRTWTVTEDDVPKKYFYWPRSAPPSHLSLIAGDCVHNLRSALDNLAFELALAHKRGALSKGIQSDSAFPILRQDIERDDNSMKRFKTMTGACVQTRRQSSSSCSHIAGERLRFYDPLWKLNELSNQEKHRLLPVASLVNLTALSYFVPDGIETEDVQQMVTAFENRAAIARYPALTKLAQKWRT